ncbi:CRISPR-associated protein Cas4 [Candidatus Woesearchaeota archaeon]|nr:CRISPR-associated protein Cas4 [Candidatus Woesearchaeota archaeon]
MLISVTSLSGYLYCPRKLFLTHVLGLVEVPKEVLVKGSIRHETYDSINKIEEELVKSITKKPTLKALTSKYETEYTKILKDAVNSYRDKLKELNLDQSETFNKILPYFIRESQIRSLNLFSFIEKEGLLGEELWQSLIPKIRSEIKINSQNLQLKGIIDQIEVWKNRLVPVELKTGKMPFGGVWPGHRIQLGCYALLLEEKYGSTINYGYVHYLDHEEKRLIKINHFLRSEINDLIKKVQALMVSQEIPGFCGNENKCNACGLKETCSNNELIQNKLTEITTN